MFVDSGKECLAAVPNTAPGPDPRKQLLTFFSYNYVFGVVYIK